MADPVVHTMQIPVTMGDVDAAMIYYARYFHWMEQAFSAMLVEARHPTRGELAAGFGYPVVSAHCDYRKPVYLDDRLVQRTWISRLGRTSLTTTHEFTFAGGSAVCALGRLDRVCVVDADGLKPRPIPDWLRRLGGEGPSA